MTDRTTWPLPLPLPHQTHDASWDSEVGLPDELPVVESALNVFDHNLYNDGAGTAMFYPMYWSRDSIDLVPATDYDAGSSQYEEQPTAEESIIADYDIAAVVEDEALHVNFELPITPAFSNDYAGETGPPELISRLPAEQALVDDLDLEHAVVEFESGFICSECHHRCRNKSALNSHARQALHSPWICKCGKSFSRLDDLKRHIRSSARTTRHPCPYCNKFKAERGFPRKDHLAQHIRNYHHIEDAFTNEILEGHCCPHIECPYHTANSQSIGRVPPLKTRGELTKHFREAHNESPFPCPERGCYRVGSQGYFRRKDLLQHQKNQHPFV